MDPSNYNFGYGDNFGAGTDRNQSDPANQFGWASQWTQPASAAQAANTFPQYVSQHQQQQQQQAQQQAQNAYAALNPISTFMQQQQKPQFQKKFGNQNGGRPANRNNFGAFGGPPAPNAQMGMFGVGNEWVQPVSHNPMGGAGRGFQQQNRQTFPTKAPAWKNNQRLRPTAAQLPKKFDTTGKTPAMILHELFKTIGEEYTEIDGVPKRYRCTLTVNEQQFQMESVNKKAAKQKCAELVVRTLRQDLHMTPFEEGITAKAVPVPMNTGNGSTGNKRNADAMIGQAESKKKTSSKKSKKLTPVESAASLLDLMQKIIAESVADVKYNPVFEATEIQKEEPTVKIETDENEKKPPFRKNETQHSVTLKFVEQNKEYTRSGANRGMLKDMCIREALRDLFQVSQSDITSVARRHASNRLGTDMNVIQCLYTICSILNCTVTVECEPAEDKPLGDGKMFFMGKVSIVDFNEDGKTFETKSPSLPSKAMAKEFAAQEMLKSYFEIDPVMCVKSEGVNPQGPCSVLHAMLNKKTKQRTSIVYEFKDNVPPVAGQPNAVFYCDCVVDETDRYTGSGRSKKLAKNEAAMVALKKIFKIDFDPNQSYPLALSSRTMIEAKVSPMCRMLSEFCKREYHQMAEFYQVMPSNQIACFILLNEKEEKRLLSIGSSIQYIVEPDILNGANGTALIHMDAIVLARRALLRNLISELSVLETNPDQSVLVMKDGKAALKHNMKLYLYSNFSPVCAYSVDDAKEKSLAYVAQACLKPVPTEVLTFDEIKANKTLRIQCVADKVLKWNTLGVQGALLSNLMHPVFVESMFFGSEAPVNDDSLKYAMVNRLGENDREIGLESMPMHMKLHMGASHLFVRGSDTLESLEYNTGRTVKGSPSMACKAEIFAAYRKLQSADQSVVDYAKAKEMATEYQYEKKVFYDKLESAGLGKWQTKPAELADSFTLAAFD